MNLLMKGAALAPPFSCTTKYSSDVYSPRPPDIRVRLLPTKPPVHFTTEQPGRDIVGLAHFGVSLCVGAVHLVFVPQLLVELPHLIRFQVEDTEDRLHPVLDGYALLLGGGKNHAAACQRFFQKFCGSAAVSNR